MAKPIVAVVGRPNVGKSTLFNKLIGQRLSIVEDTPGVTRDRIYAPCEWRGKQFMLVDTGGIEPKTDDVILKQMRRQAQIAIDTADVTILLTDMKDGLTATDHEVADMLLKTGKPIVLCVNKCDSLLVNLRWNFMSSTTWGWGNRFRSPLPMAMGRGICWTRCLTCFPNMRGKTTARNILRLR